MKLKKKIMGIGTAVLCAANFMAFGVQSLIANAAGYSGEMTYGNHLSYYKVDEDEDGTDDRIYISGCDKSAVSIEIPDEIDGLPVMGINSQAFYNHSNLESVTIPDSITFIGSGAFEGTALANNQTGAKYVGKWVVECDEDTVSVEIKDGTIGIACSAFRPGTSAPIPEIVGNESDNRPVSSLTSVTIPDSVKYIGACAFLNCSSLTSVTISDSVISIGAYAFGGCESLTGITIPNGVASIGQGTFQDCKSITSLAIPESITSIGEYAFLDCSSLKSINVSENNPNYLSEDGILFSKDKTTIIEFPEGKTDRSYIIDDSVTSISELAFHGCKSLESISIPESVTSIGENAFRKCSSLKSITIPESVTSIGDHVFRECSSLKSIKIPKSVTSIGDAAFYDCSSLVSVIIPESVTFIDSAAFTFCSSLENITILNPDCEIDDGIVTICNGNVYSNDIFYDGVIIGYKGSTAQEYAEKWGYSFNRVSNKSLEVTASGSIRGDISGNNSIDLYDAIIIAEFLANPSRLTQEQQEIADFNGDGVVNLYDAIGIAVYMCKNRK